MLTLQILDSGQTFLHQLEDRPLVLGSARDADVRLTEAGVAPHHARIEPIRRGERTLYKIVDLESPAGTKVNGAAVAQVLLELGDRVEIGRAVLVLGKSVARPATPEDVLDERTVRAPIVRRAPRARVAAATHRPGSRWIWPAALAAAAAVVLAFVLFGSGSDQTPAAMHRVDQLRRTGRFDEARQELDRLRASWAEGVEERLDLVAAAETRIESLERAVEERKRRLLTDAERETYAELNRGLQNEERDAASPEQQEAARILRGDLTAILRDAGVTGPRLAADPTPEVGENPPQPQQPPAQQTVPVAVEPTEDELLEDIARLQRQGLYVQAIEAARSGLAEAGSAAAAEPYRRRLDELRADARREMQRLVDRARKLEQEGELVKAIAHLAEHAHRFPGAGDLSLLNQELATLRDREVRRTEPGRPQTPAEVELEQTRRVSIDLVASLLAQVRDLELRGDFPAAAELLRRGAGMVEARDPRYAERLRDQAADYELIGGMSESVATAMSQPVAVELRDGRAASVTGVADCRIRVETAEGDLELTWPELPLASVRTLLQRTRAPAHAWLGAAVLGYRNADRETAEELLVHALKAERGLKADIDKVVTRGRRDRRDPRGYELVQGEFVSARELESRERAKQLERRLTSVVRQSADARDRFLEEVLAEGPEALDALLIAFRRQHQTQVAKLQDLPVRKQYEKLLAQRVALDEARKHALELIYDEQKYFYPYKPPAVSGAKHAEYNDVQREVDERVDRVRPLWEDDRITIRPPGSVQTEMAKLNWLGKVLADFGERDQEASLELEWLHTLPEGRQPLTIRNFCRTAEERRELDLWERIEAFNERILAGLRTEERRQVEITNDYRRMFCHRPLALNDHILEAARGHAVEMSNLGYFGHFSPTEGLRTPFDRMRKAGYKYGVSENIARTSSPEGAHYAWLHSSGHHRNLLNPSHTEFAVGVAAGNYVQNFGRGEEFGRDF